MNFWYQLCLLLVISGVCLIVCALGGGIAMVAAQAVGGPNAGLHLVMWSQNLILMIGAPLLWTWAVKTFGKQEGRPKQGVFASLRMDCVDLRFMLVTLALMLVSIPASDALDVASLHFPWPESVRSYCANSFLESQKVYMALLNVDGFLGLVELFLLMCLSTAIGEEMLFRGALLNCFVKGGRWNWHVAIWVVGLIFALVHFEMMGFFSRWLLGAMLAYLVFWSRSLWPAILAHCTNNLMALIGYKMSTPEELMTFDRTCSFSPVVVLVSVVVTAGTLYYLWSLRKPAEE